MRKLWIDSDCACDDCMSMIMAFYHKDIEVVGISVVTGYRPASVVKNNPLSAAQEAEVPAPPVFVDDDSTVGINIVVPEVHVHGEDAIGDLGIELEEGYALSEGYAATALLDAINKYEGELEIITLGPLTNLAKAFLLDSSAPKKIKMIWICGGCGDQHGNLNAKVEANLGGDPEAAQIVMQSGAPLTVMPFDCSVVGDVQYSEEDMLALKNSGRAGDFIFRANHDLYDIIIPNGGTMVQVDPSTMAAVIWPDLILEQNEAYCAVECARGYTYGMFIEDAAVDPEKRNGTVIHKIDGNKFKRRTLKLFTNKG